jgi:GTP pyrophosphokinase
LYTSEITVFTPKGEQRKLPFGATALDFAYDIHTKIGNKAIGAKINHKIEPVTKQIYSGDQIEIITADNASPKPEWIDIVVTTKAKQAIANYLKREREDNISHGLAIFEQKVAQFNITLSGSVLRKVMQAYGCKYKDEFYSKIGAGIISLDNIEKIIKSSSASKMLKFWKLWRDSRKDDNIEDINTQTANQVPEIDKFTIASCCNPLPGDSVVGFKDPMTGRIIVHKATCHELNRLASLFGQNIIKEQIHWSQHKAVSYLSTIELRGIDRMGLLLEISRVVSEDFSINIREVSIRSHDGIFEGNLSIYVQDTDSLNAIMDKFRHIKGIESVKRSIDNKE